MRKMVQSRFKRLLLLALGTGLVFFSGSNAQAQEKYAISFTSLAKNATYTQQYAIAVGDVPGHKIRIFEVRRMYPQNPPVFEGVPVKEAWRQGYSDYVDVNGPAWGYDNYILENGDRIFLQWVGTSAALGNTGGPKKSEYIGILTITGGTGKFLGIRGMLKENLVFSPDSGFNEAQTVGEYWIER